MSVQRFPSHIVDESWKQGMIGWCSLQCMQQKEKLEPHVDQEQAAFCRIFFCLFVCFKGNFYLISEQMKEKKKRLWPDDKKTQIRIEIQS